MRLHGCSMCLSVRECARLCVWMWMWMCQSAPRSPCTTRGLGRLRLGTACPSKPAIHTQRRCPRGVFETCLMCDVRVVDSSPCVVERGGSPIVTTSTSAIISIATVPLRYTDGSRTQAPMPRFSLYICAALWAAAEGFGVLRMTASDQSALYRKDRYLLCRFQCTPPAVRRSPAPQRFLRGVAVQQETV